MGVPCVAQQVKDPKKKKVTHGNNSSFNQQNEINFMGHFD